VVPLLVSEMPSATMGEKVESSILQPLDALSCPTLPPPPILTSTLPGVTVVPFSIPFVWALVAELADKWATTPSSLPPVVRAFNRELERVRAEETLVADRSKLGALREGRVVMVTREG